jgi:hypothetical protein
MSLPTFDALNEYVSRECDEAIKHIDAHSAEWQAIVRYLNAKKWALAAQAIRGGPPEAVEHARGKAAMLSELLQIRGQTSTEG